MSKRLKQYIQLWREKRLRKWCIQVSAKTSDQDTVVNRANKIYKWMNQETLQVSKPPKSKSQPELPYYYLRDGDFLPDSVNEYYGGTGMSHDMIKELKTLGNIFETKEEAAQASEKVREFIRSSFGKQP